jgi:SAM-dependent methyltransferase
VTDPRLPASQYAKADNLAARKRLWSEAVAEPSFDLVAWVLDLADIETGSRLDVLDAGCGNGDYAGALDERSHRGVYVGLDRSHGMLEAFDAPARVQGDLTALPVADRSFDVVIAAHVLYHVPDVGAAVAELSRATRPRGLALAVTNGPDNLIELKSLVEEAVGTGWRMTRPADRVFGLHNGEPILAEHFSETRRVECPPGRLVVTNADLVADYVASVGDLYQAEAKTRWATVSARVHALASAAVERDGAIRFTRSTGAFVCRP